MNISKSIIEALKITGLTQRELANKCGYNESHISRAIKINKATSVTIERFCVGLDMKASEFIALGELN